MPTIWRGSVWKVAAVGVGDDNDEQLLVALAAEVTGTSRTPPAPTTAIAEHGVNLRRSSPRTIADGRLAH